MVFRISGAPCSSGSTPYLIGNTYYSISGFDFAIPTCPSSNDFVGGQKLFLTIVASDYMTNAAVAPSGWETAITVNASNTNEVMIAATSLPSFSSQVSGYKWSTGPVNVHHYSSIWRILEAPCPEEDPKDEGITLIIPTGHIGLA
jgi:hypothetical protein